MEPGDQDLISSALSHTDRFHPASLGAPDLSLFGIPVLAGRLAFAVRVPARRGAGAHLEAQRVEGSGRALPEPARGGPGLGAACSELTRGVEPISPAGASAVQTDLNPLCVQMALGLLEEGFSPPFFHKGKPPSALYQLKAKITCFGNHYLAIRASAH